MRKLILTIALLASTASLACDRSRAETMKRLAEMQEISAQKDSLLKDVTATTAFIAELGRQVATVRNLKTAYGTGGPSDLEDNLTPDQRRARVLEQVREITERVNMAENRLAVSRKRVSELTGSDAEKSARLAQFDSTIASFRDIIENQKTQIAQFTEQVNALTAENTQLKSANATLTTEKTIVTGQRDSLQVDRNTVYYIIADRESLVKHGVIEKSGGFLGIGTTPVPARDLDKTAFIPMDRTTVLEIALPNPEKTYQIISRQDLSALETAPDKNGVVKGSIKIKDHEQFWTGSQFLIIIER